ncbi:hypothetical protein UA45_06085 [Morganella morganii]|uniref:Uncharacterized protein n=1 Tax=Morganella morganii TaxID=582 RepID=A0A0D8LCG2_MORMO|nr:hypothetical protein UA45_06085 [Morganella morganii]
MLSPVSNSVSADAITVSRENNNCPEISPKLALLKEKLNTIEPGKRTDEITYFINFIERNETQMRGIPAISDRLSTVLNVVNLIKDNIIMEGDNMENLSQLSNLTREMEGMLNSGECKNTHERVAAEVSRSAEKVAKEAQRAAERVTNEAERSADKVKNEFQRLRKNGNCNIFHD